MCTVGEAEVEQRDVSNEGVGQHRCLKLAGLAISFFSLFADLLSVNACTPLIDIASQHEMSSKRSDGNGLSKEPKVQGGQGSEQEWSKVLWRKQPFPDNHVPPSFLSELKHIRESLLVRTLCS